MEATPWNAREDLNGSDRLEPGRRGLFPKIGTAMSDRLPFDLDIRRHRGGMMTEAEWQSKRATPQGLVLDLQGTSATRTKVGRRKLRLFACGCCRLVWPHIKDSHLINAVEVAERFADGVATAKDLQTARNFADSVTLRTYSEDVSSAQADTLVALVIATTETKPHSAAFMVTTYPLPLAGYCGEKKKANALICDTLRDIFGNPFRAVPVDPTWLTSTVVALARQMYESRDFSAMPILADALQDAGCENATILDHCRGVGPHCRGCWLVDKLLGKE
jgi:hypothetical protein